MPGHQFNGGSKGNNKDGKGNRCCVKMCLLLAGTWPHKTRHLLNDKRRTLTKYWCNVKYGISEYQFKEQIKFCN